jgi:hypothetical protein
MGTQQSLSLFLSVMILCIAISVGIYAFNVHIVNANRNAIIADMTYIASIALAYHKSPQLMGGGEGVWISRKILYNWLSFETTQNGERLITDNGEIKIDVLQNGQELLFYGYCYETDLDESRVIRALLSLKGPDPDPLLKFLD